jgi:hypothetical protein
VYGLSRRNEDFEDHEALILQKDSSCAFVDFVAS